MITNPDNRKIIKNYCGKRKVFPIQSESFSMGKLQFQSKRNSYSYVILLKERSDEDQREWSSQKERRENDLVSGAEEGRDKLR